jgi:translation initiation factor 5
LIITKTEVIVKDCKACGQRTNVDMRHKLTTFIIKNPPKREKLKVGRKGTDGLSAESPTTAGADAQGDDGAESDDELTRRIKSEAAELSNATSLKEDEWSMDTSAEAVKARMKDIEAKMQLGLVLGDDDGSDEDANSPYSQLGQWVAEQKGEATAIDVYKRAQELGIEKKHKTVQVLAQTLFTKNIAAEVSKYGAMFVKVSMPFHAAMFESKDSESQMNTSEKHQKSLLGGLERFIGVDHPELIPAVPKILMAFYQADALEEEVIKQWGTHVSKKYVDKEISKKVRKASEPFLKVSIGFFCR